MMPIGIASARDTPIANTVSSRVVGMRSRTRGSAGSRWKKDWPKSPRTMLPTKRANCFASGSLNPIASRRAARSASGASGIMRAMGSPLTWRIANVTSDTPASTITRRPRRRATRLSTGTPSPDQGRGLPLPGRRLGVEEPEPLVGPGRVLHLLRDAEGVVLRPQEDARRLVADHVLDLAVEALPLGLVHR